METSNLLTTAQAAERLGISWERARQLAAGGRFPGAFQHGRAWAIPVKAVEEFQPNPHGVRLGRKARKQPVAE